MSEREKIALVDRLRALPNETEWVEFKHNRYEPQVLGEYLSALANAAGLAGEPRGYLVFGITDSGHAVAGTDFDPYAIKGKGNQDLLPWLSAGLRPNTGFQPHIVEHPDGRVVLFEVGPANGEPVSFYGTPYVRVGSSKTELRHHPEKARALWTRGSDWSAEVCGTASLADLDAGAIATAREQFVVKHPGQAAAVADWDDLTFLNKARVLRQGDVSKEGDQGVPRGVAPCVKRYRKQHHSPLLGSAAIRSSSKGPSKRMDEDAARRSRGEGQTDTAELAIPTER